MSQGPIDVRLLNQEEIPQGAFPGAGGDDLRVCFDPSAHTQAWNHGTRTTAVEICGILVGRWQRDNDGVFAEITNIIECDSARSGQAEVTFTHDSWAKINQEMDSKYANLRIIGWYHTHPDFGIFLSDYDVFIHQNFFNGPGQIALVIDPIRKIEGVFCWRDGKPTLMSHYWVGSNILIRPAEQPPAAGSRLAAISAANQVAPPSPTTVAPRGFDWSGSLSTFGLVIAGVVMGYIVAGWSDSKKEAYYRQFVIRQCFEQGVLKVGMEDHLEEAMAHLKSLAADMESVVPTDVLRGADDAGKDGAKTDKETREKWGNVQKDMQGVATELQIIANRYAFTPDEQRMLQKLARGDGPPPRKAGNPDEVRPELGGKKGVGGDSKALGKAPEKPSVMNDSNVKEGTKVPESRQRGAEAPAKATRDKTPSTTDKTVDSSQSRDGNATDKSSP